MKYIALYRWIKNSVSQEILSPYNLRQCTIYNVPRLYPTREAVYQKPSIYKFVKQAVRETLRDPLEKPPSHLDRDSIHITLYVLAFKLAVYSEPTPLVRI